MKRAILIILAAAIICCGCVPYGSIDIVPQATAAPRKLALVRSRHRA